MISTRNRSGALYHLLEPIKRHGLDMTRIESRPALDTQWDYIFFLDLFGVGLIGGSLAMSLKKANYCNTIIGCSRSVESLQKAKELGVIDDYTLDPIEAVNGADMILLAVPMGAMGSVLQSIKGHVEAGAVVTDAGSAKASVVAAAREVFGEIPPYFVPAHPIAGREKSGVEAAIVDLYADHKVIVTPLPETDAAAEQRVIAMWQATGAEVESMEVEKHDQVLAATSHLPHVVSTACLASRVCLRYFQYCRSLGI